ncbi:MAG: flippase-like domain-containing protein, partial [Solirubrobacterales bacterium]|nr:flippase-like domain-containing protein [Solirubrobacterales bacterium]
ARMPAALDARHLGRRIAQLVVLGAVSLLAISTLPGLGEVRERFAGADPAWLVLAAGLEAASMLGFVAAFRGVFCRRMGWGFSAQVAVSEQAANVLLPAGGAGGLALGAWALSRGGMATGHIARRSVAFWLVTSSANFVAVVAVGVAVATGALPSDVSLWLALGPAALATVAIAAVLALPGVLRRRAPGHGGGDRRRKVRAAAHTAADGVEDAVRLLRTGGALVAGGALAYMTFDIAVLGATFAAFGGAPPVADLLLAYLLGQLGGLIPVPGGIGGTDGGLVAALVLFGTPLAPAAAAVLAYRVFQLGLPAAAGTVAFATLRRTLSRDARPAARCAPLAEAA